MSVKSYLKRCEEFSICSQVGDSAGLVFFEPSVDRMTMYQIIVKGSGRMAKIFDSDYILGDSHKNNFIDLKKYLNCQTIFESYEPFHIYGFNTLSKNQHWDGKLVNESFEGDDKSWLVCFDGRPVINDVELSRMDYAKLENKHYNLISNNSIVGVSTKI